MYDITFIYSGDSFTKFQLSETINQKIMSSCTHLTIYFIKISFFNGNTATKRKSSLVHNSV